MAKAQVVISSKNELNTGLKGARRDLDQFSLYAQQLGNKLKSALSIASIATAAVVGLKKLGDECKKCVEEFTAAEKVSKRLTAVWENVGQTSGKSSKQIDDYAEAIEKVTYFSSESIKESALLLAATESLTEEGFDRALQASLDLAAAMDEDVTSAASTLAKAIQEPESALSRLKSIGVNFTDEEKEQIKALTDANKEFEAQEIILSKIEERYKGVAQAVADTPSGKLDAIKDTLGDIRETLGQGIVGALEPAFTFILDMLQKIHKWAKEHIDTSSFWKNASAGNSHSLYTDYSKEFIQDRQVDAMKDLSDQLEMMRESGWGKFIEESIGIPLEDALFYQADTLSDIMERYAKYIYGDNWQNFLGTVDGFFEVVTEQYQPLVDILDTIDGALREYDTFGSVSSSGSSGSLGGSGTQTAETEVVKSALQEFFGSWSSSSQTLQMRSLIDSITQAESLIAELSIANTEEAAKILEDAGFSGSKNSALTALEEILASLNERLDSLTALPELANSPTLTSLSDILDKYGKQSNSYQIMQLKEEYNRIAEAYEYASDEDRVYLAEILKSNEEQRMALESSGDNEQVMLGLLDRIQNDLGEKIASLFGASSEQGSSFIGSVFSSFTSSMGEAGEVASSLAQNMAAMGPMLGAIATALKYVFEGLSETLGPIMNDIVAYGIEPLRQLGRVIGNIVLPLMETVMPLVQKSAESLSKVFNTLGAILQPIVEIIATAITPIIDALATSLEFIAPILKGIAYVLATISGVFSYVQQALMHFVATFMNWLAGLNLLGWHPFEGLRMTDPGSPGSFVEHMAKTYAGLDETLNNTSAVDTISTQQAVASASYRGATSVTINIYAEGPIVGEGGMREFARMIRDEFDALNYYGVTT